MLKLERPRQFHLDDDIANWIQGDKELGTARFHFFLHSKIIGITVSIRSREKFILGIH